MIPEAKQPPAYKLATLPPQESVSWRFAVRITGFGRISVQPFVSLPVNIPLQPGRLHHKGLQTAAVHCILAHLVLTSF